MSDKEEDKACQVPFDLWVVEAKMKAIGYLIQYQVRDSDPIDQKDADYGLGQILVDLGEDVREIKGRIERDQSRD